MFELDDFLHNLERVRERSIDTEPDDVTAASHSYTGNFALAVGGGQYGGAGSATGRSLPGDRADAGSATERLGGG